MKILPHKFFAKPVTVDDIYFSSKKESRRYQELLYARKSGDAVFFLRQVPFHLPGHSKYICDFMVFWSDGTITFEDVKGFKTNIYKLKKRLVEDLYPISITEI